jgi:metal iron transporter
MNCPSRTDPIFNEGYNQNPNALNADSTTRADLDHMANARLRRDHRIDPADTSTTEIEPSKCNITERERHAIKLKGLDSPGILGVDEGRTAGHQSRDFVGGGRITMKKFQARLDGIAGNISRVLRKYAKFIGPGFMVAVAYIDPGRSLSLRFS